VNRRSADFTRADQDGTNSGRWRVSFGVRGKQSACHPLFEAPAQILKNLLLPLLHFKEDRFSKSRVILRRMDLASFQQDLPQVGHALLSL